MLTTLLLVLLIGLPLFLWVVLIIVQSIDTTIISVKALNRIFSIEQDLKKAQDLQPTTSFKSADLAKLQEDINIARLQIKTTWKFEMEILFLPFFLVRLLPKGFTYSKKLLMVLCDKDLEK